MLIQQDHSAHVSTEEDDQEWKRALRMYQERLAEPAESKRSARHHARVSQAGQVDVAGVLGAAGHLGGPVDSRDRLPDHPPRCARTSTTRPRVNAPRMDTPVLMTLEAKGCAFTDEAPLQDDLVRWNGQAVAVVVAESQECADAAARLIEVEYEPADARVAFDDLAPLVSDSGVMAAKVGGERPFCALAFT